MSIKSGFTCKAAAVFVPKRFHSSLECGSAQCFTQYQDTAEYFEFVNIIIYTLVWDRWIDR